ncbi:MAG: apolipoprotein N-acyltransferase [Candidatus Dactylopiibacterium carminicum]|uniref:Apolipoprotein N-acyltransferase n=2 Tax=Candidatus Dactylopiibacterium carminicum TaxID=857335 RepID=A0A272ERM8_9RHOO|nr:apolipoprotein N-acyltransferase [Candidatus Dactylopiibacterium carminicum]PAS92742.1 MAG: apolipoprotein N-acyltransferase [Candidatus Dactylopiibacterium carminicum]PAS96191.1 MAG: apolipoprotein N-acyltransferase [Candidatus Dactylopiibacterium carminicum]PAS98853.1 MAG: apolipoprotein N-acyltransferase [Candidatus Dactylopiibacterium carminicum]
MPMPFLFAVLAGAASVLAYAPFEWFWLMPLCWGSWYALLRQKEVRPGRAALLGWSWGAAALFAGLCWLVVALNRYGGLSAPLSVALIMLFCAALALIYIASASALFARLRPTHWLLRTLFAAACWTWFELLRGQIFPSFPWLAIGYTQTPPSPLAGWAAILGVYGVGFLLAWTSALLVEAWRLPACHRSALGLALLPWLSGAGLRQIAWSEPTGEPLRVALIQTNVPQDQKWNGERMGEWLSLHLELLRNNPAQLTVMPETTLPLLAEHLPVGYLDALKAQAQSAGGDVVLGVFTRDDGRVYNSAISLGTHASQRYSKNHLVPLGEYVPWGFQWFLDLAKIPMANQTPGGERQPLMQIGGQRIAMNICYEDAFGEELRRALPEATLMLNISNLAWYGNSHAQPQHLQISRMRALESARPQLRATNTGMTGVVLPDGSVSHLLPAFTRGAVAAEVRGYTGATPFVQLGDWPIKLLCVLIFGAVVLDRWRWRV